MKRVNANGSAGSPCVRVGNRQAFSLKAFSITGSLFFYLKYNIPMIIGLTGGIGCGKSAAADFFIKLGINVIDADALAKDSLNLNTDGYNQFLEEFGTSYIANDKTIDRKKLRFEIFSNPDKKIKLERIIHPIVGKRIVDFIQNSTSLYSVIMVPLIYETNSSQNYDRILLIDCDEELQIKRASARDNQNELQIKSVMASQASRTERISISDDIIINSKSLEHLESEVAKVHNKYMELLNNA